MTQQKDFKRLVRARMQKTGEAYTAARASILKKSAARNGSSTPAPAGAKFTLPPVNYEALAGVKDRLIEEKTGCNWARWTKALDQWGAATMTHTQIARLVHEKWKIDGWWSQTVTVGYERIKGRRAIGQRTDGSYEATKSRTFNVPVSRLFDAWADASVRKRWLDEAGVRVRSSIAPKSIRFRWSDDRIVAAFFAAKGANKSVVSLAHSKLPDRAASDQSKKYWSERLDALAGVLR